MNEMRTPRLPNERQFGFTLIEIAIVLVIVGLLLGGLLMPLATQVDIERRQQTEKTMEEIREALIGYAVVNNRLPCPDTSGDGQADDPCAGGQEGLLPWVTLGVAQTDAWGNRFLYRVSDEFTNIPAGGCSTSDDRIGLCDTGDITVNTRNPTTKAVQTLATGVAALILSHGKNGFGATTSTGGTIPPGPLPATRDERLNMNNDATFYSRTPTPAPNAANCSDSVVAQPYCEFDDIVAWLPTNVLFNRMVAAGVLP
jgi:prepilin-type N-terminal cleavage/methylation domain-containing protein